MATQRKPPPKEEAKRPVISFGPFPTDRSTSIEVAVWENEIEGEERTFTTYNVTLKRSYRDEKGVWHPNQNFRPHDLPVVLHAMAKAHGWILDKKTESED